MGDSKDNARHVVGTTADLEYDGRAQVELPDGEEVLLLKHKGELLAVQAYCPHQYVPLIGSEILGEDLLVCPMHGWKFSLTTGVDPDNAFICVQKYKCGVDGDKLWVGEPLPIPSPM